MSDKRRSDSSRAGRPKGPILRKIPTPDQIRQRLKTLEEESRALKQLLPTVEVLDLSPPNPNACHGRSLGGAQ